MNGYINISNSHYIVTTTYLVTCPILPEGEARRASIREVNKSVESIASG